MPKYVKRRVPVETYERFERYAERLGIGMPETRSTLLEFMNEALTSIIVSIRELEGNRRWRNSFP